MILLVNKKHLFNENMIKDFKMVEYENSDEELIYIESETFRHYEMLRAHLKIDGIKIDISSGYRSLEKQENLFLEFMNKYGIDYAESVVAMPGTSEHHTGLAIDICLYNGAEFVTVLLGNIMTMPGLPKVPNYEKIDLIDGKIVGLS